jgi:hypothetical protein
MKTKEKVLRFKSCSIESTPRDKFPDMVTITKTTKALSELLDKKFINLEKAKVSIETLKADKLIESGGKSVNKQLMTIGKGSEMNFDGED